MSDLTQWNFIKSHTITHPSGINDEYQIKIITYRGCGISNNYTVYLNNRCKPDYSDIRFTDSSYNLLSYWIEEINIDHAIIWIKLPEITAQSIIYIIYGNKNAESLSDGESTFLFFDGFDDTSINETKWNISELGGGSLTLSNSELTITKPNTNTIISKIYTNEILSLNNTSIIVKAKPTDIDINNGIKIDNIYTRFQSINKFDVYLNKPGTGTVGSYTISTSPLNNYYIIEHKINTNHVIWDVQPNNVQNTYNLDFTINDSALLLGYFTSGITSTSHFELVIDYIIQRRYSEIEPTHGDWGEENVLNKNSLFIDITPTMGLDPLTIEYTIYIPEITLYDFNLNYGDGTVYSSNEQYLSFATTHTYDTPGTYTVWAEGYTEFATHVFYEIPYGVTVSAPSVVASFTTSQSYNTITFTNTSTGNINECYWDFGDGNHSYEQNPIHTYWSPATYTVTLYASNQYQYDTYTTTVTVTQILTPPEVYFTPNNLNVISPTLPYTVNFTNLSTPAFGCTYNWLIDGTTYTTENPSHSFATYGMYDVGLTVTNALGSATKTYNDAIRITRKGKTFYEVINYADTPATFHVEVFNEVATSADTIIQAHIFDESINFVQDEIPDEPGLDEWGMRHFYSSINEWGHRIISAVTDWGNRILYNGSTLDNSPVTLFKAQEFREDVVFEDSWQFGTT